MTSDTKQRFLRSTGAAAFSQLWRVGVTFVTEMVLRRVIPEADWGVWRWALTIFLVMGAVRDLGLVYHVVRVRPRPYGNLLALEAIWGGALMVLAFLGAPALAGASAGSPQVVAVLRALTLFLFFEGLSTVPRVYLEGELKIGRAVVPEIVRNLCITAVSIGLGLAGYGIWSLVAGHVVSTALYAAMLWWRVRGQIPLHFDPAGTLALVRQSSPLALIWLLVILVRFIDPLILYPRFGDVVVGNYDFAYQNAFRVSEILVPAVARALYPALAAFAAEAQRPFTSYSLATVLVVALEAPAALFLFLNAELALRILGGAQWTQAPAFLRILCFAPLADPFSRLGGELLKVRHRDRIWIVSALVTLATYLGGGLLMTSIMGPIGMAWVNLIPLGGLVMAWALHGESPDGFWHMVRRLAFVYLVPLPLFALAWFAGGDDEWLRFGLSLLAVALSLAIYVRRFGRDFVAFFRAGKEARASAPAGEAGS